jgi:hypothetical protein
MMLFLICIVCACTLIGALRGHKKHRYDMSAHANAAFKGAIDGLLVGIVAAVLIYCLWQVLKFWTGLIVLGWIFWPKKEKPS